MTTQSREIISSIYREAMNEKDINRLSQSIGEYEKIIDRMNVNPEIPKHGTCGDCKAKKKCPIKTILKKYAEIEISDDFYCYWYKK